MTEFTEVLKAIDHGDANAAAHLLPLVYEDLRKLAASRLAEEQPGQTLQPTALVHEAYLRLVGDMDEPRWQARSTDGKRCRGRRRRGMNQVSLVFSPRNKPDFQNSRLPSEFLMLERL